MGHRPTMQPIVIKGSDAIKAVEAAIGRSLKDGKATKLCKEAVTKAPVVKESPKH